MIERRSHLSEDSARRGIPAGLEMVTARRLLRTAPVVWLALRPGDRTLVAAGDSVLAGALIAHRSRNAALVEVPAASVHGEAVAGAWWHDDGGRHGIRRSRSLAAGGELLWRTDGDWRVAAGTEGDPLEAPVAGIVREVRPGVGIGLATTGAALQASIVLGGPARGRLEILADADEELRPGSLDVGRAGSIVVAGARVDAGILTRARAMGIRGIVAASISSQDLRDIEASEARQRASLHALPPFAVLALDGHLRRPIPGPVMAALRALDGQQVAIVGDPPLLLFDSSAAALPKPPVDLVRIRSGAAAGRDGRWLGLAGRRRFASGVHLESGLVDVGDGQPLVLPLGDLERYD